MCQKTKVDIVAWSPHPASAETAGGSSGDAPRS